MSEKLYKKACREVRQYRNEIIANTDANLKTIDQQLEDQLIRKLKNAKNRKLKYAPKSSVPKRDILLNAYA